MKICVIRGENILLKKKVVVFVSKNIIYLGLGTNLGDKKSNLEKAISEIETQIGKISQKSSIYSTKALGFDSENDFLNQVIEIQSDLTVLDVLNEIIQIEKKLGRETKSHQENYEDRLIDIDILYFNSEIIKQTELSVPHKRLSERKFVLVPLAEIAPDWIDPIHEKSIQELLQETPDKSEIFKL